MSMQFCMDTCKLKRMLSCRSKSFKRTGRSMGAFSAGAFSAVLPKMRQPRTSGQATAISGTPSAGAKPNHNLSAAFGCSGPYLVCIRGSLLARTKELDGTNRSWSKNTHSNWQEILKQFQFDAADFQGRQLSQARPGCCLRALKSSTWSAPWPRRCPRFYNETAGPCAGGRTVPSPLGRWSGDIALGKPLTPVLPPKMGESEEKCLIVLVTLMGDSSLHENYRSIEHYDKKKILAAR